MDAQMTRAQGHHYYQDPLHHPGVVGEEDHHEKKSILKKVKAKAKKVKDTIASKAHVGHGHEHGQEYNQGDEDDEYDQDDEKLVQDPEIHGAPNVNITRASAGPTPTLGENVCPGTFQTKVTDPDSTVPAQSKYDSVAPWNSSFDHDAKSDQFKGTLGEMFKHTNVPTGTLGEKFGEDTDVLKDRQEDPSPILHQAIKIGDPASANRHGAGHDENSGFFKSPLGGPLDEQPREDVSLNTHKRRHEDVSNFGAEVGGHNGEVSPTDAGVTPILHSFDKMAIYDEPQQHKKDSGTTGSHDQFSSSTIPDRQFIPESFGVTTDQNHPQDMNVDQSNAQQGGYTGKIYSVASAVADKAISAKNVVASKIGYVGNDHNVASQNSGGANVSGLEPPKQQQQSTYTEKLSSATGAIADEAASAKNVVASKFGYGGTDNSAAAQRSEISREGDHANEQSDGGGVTGYGRQIASTVTGKLAPVYGTVAGAGSAVLSKIPGTGMGNKQKTGEDMDIGATHEKTTDDTGMGAARETGAGSVRDTDRGVGMKGYIAEKFKPSDEDKALSEVISGALHKRGTTVEEDKKGVGEVEGTKGVHEAVKDTLHKRNTDEDMDREKMNVPMGKVTESEEVAKRLGSSEEERTGKVYPGTGNESPSTGVVDKVKGAFTNWFGKGGEMNPSMAFNDHNTQSEGTIGEENASGDGERRLQAN